MRNKSGIKNGSKEKALSDSQACELATRLKRQVELELTGYLLELRDTLQEGEVVRSVPRAHNLFRLLCELDVYVNVALALSPRKVDEVTL